MKNRKSCVISHSNIFPATSFWVGGFEPEFPDECLVVLVEPKEKRITIKYESH